MTIEALRARQQELQAQAEAIVAKADQDERDLTDDEVEDIEAKKSEIDKLAKQITAREVVNAASTGRGRKTDAEPRNGRVPAQAKDNRFGFTNFGAFAQCVKEASLNPGQNAYQRLVNAAPSTSANEGVGADGGFVVPPEFRTAIWQKVIDEESLFGRADRLVTSGNNLVIPADETTPWQSSGGIQAYWENELAQIQQSKPLLEMKQIRLNKLTALVPVSEELLEDAPGLSGFLNSKAPSKMGSKLNTAIVRGTGVGQPLGILNAPSTIVVDAEGSQSADTVLYANIIKMWNRLYGPLRRNAAWLINQDVEPQLDLMEFRPGSSTPVPVYLPSGGASDRPYATLKGRPVMPVEACSTLGDKGDIILTDLTQYMGVSKGTDIRTDVSVHLFFDADAVAFRFIFRVAGMPWWGSAVAPQFGNTTRSWAVTLAARA